MNFNWLIAIQLTVLSLIIKENSCVPASPPHSAAIVFPEENFDECFLNETNSIQQGECKLLDDCPEILRKWQQENVYPKTCYFLKADQYVCCPKPSITTTTTEMPTTISILPSIETSTKSILELLLDEVRPSELECDLNQPTRPAVVNGIPTKVDEFPFMAALGWAANADDSVWYRCGGAVISNKFILTAAHCAEIGGEFATVARIGGSNLTDPSVGNVKIKRFISHPAYNSSASLNDIALVELEEPLKAFSVCCLWTDSELPSGNVTALGYGHTRFGGAASDQLLKAPLKVVTQQLCNDYFRSSADAERIDIVASHLCANDPDELRDTCQGDSGGPLVIATGAMPFTKTHLVGITSFGLGCAGVPPSIYTRVSTFVDWIETIVWPKADRKSQFF